MNATYMDQIYTVMFYGIHFYNSPVNNSTENRLIVYKKMQSVYFI